MDKPKRGPNKGEADRDLTVRKFYRAEQEAGFAEQAPTDTPQTRHPAYRLAFADTDFLLREELRPVRFQLELLKPEMLLDEAGVGSTLVMYGSARIPPPGAVETALAGAKDLPEPERKVVESLAAKAKYYTEAYRLVAARVQHEVENLRDGKRDKFDATAIRKTWRSERRRARKQEPVIDD